MRSPRTLALALIGSTHVSLCAGSMLSVLLTLLAHTADPSFTLTPMTPALEGGVCLLETPFDGVTPKEDKSACNKGEQCFENIAFSVHKDAIVVVSHASFVNLGTPMDVHPSPVAFFDLFRSLPGRPPGHSRLLAMSAVQRE